MKKDTFLVLVILAWFSVSCSNQSFKQAISYKKPVKTLPERIDSIIINKMNQYNIPGLSIGVVKNDSILYTKGYGFKSINNQQPITENTIFHTGSVSKLFTALAIINLINNKQITLEDKLVEVLPNLKFKDKKAEGITIKTLLNHTSGIRDIKSYNWSNNNEADNTLKNYLTYKKLKLDFEPSTKYQYSNLAYDVLGYVVEQVSGLTFEDYVKENILLPSNMTESDFRYFKIEDTLKTFPHSRRWLSHNVYKRNIYPYTREHAPSSTLNSSAKELSKWMISFLHKLENEIEPNLIFAMTKESTTLNEFIGLGFQLYSIEGTKAIGHFGGDKGFRSYLLMIPQKRIGLVVLANCDYNEDFRQDILYQILKLI